MANTYSQIVIQAVFAVQARESLINPIWKEELFKYIGGIFREKKQKLLAIGGVEDHIPPTIRNQAKYRYFGSRSRRESE